MRKIKDEKNGKFNLILFLVLFIMVTFLYGSFSRFEVIDVPHKVFSIEQLDVTTNNIDNLKKYKTATSGEEKKVNKLLSSLPLGAVPYREISIDSKDKILKIDYSKAGLSLGEVGEISLNQKLITAHPETYKYEVKRNIIYNSAVIFTLIGGLKEIEYSFSDTSIFTYKEDYINFYGKIDLKADNQWKMKVQNPLNNKKYTEDAITKLIKEK